MAVVGKGETGSVEGRPLDDSELVARARAGDVAAYEELVALHESIALRAAYCVVRDPDAAADAVQSAFVKAFYALGRFRPDAPFAPWLLKIVTNEARNQSRSTMRRSRLALRLAEGPPR